MANRLQFRRGTAAQATIDNPVLAAGELAYETDTRKFKLGDGTTAWNDLAYGGLPGPTGPMGPKGDQGIQGVPGERGIQGPRGSKGDIGDNYWQGSNRFITTSEPDDQIGIDGDFWFVLESN